MNEKSLSKWSSIAEIISSVAILVTLIYLAIQTQQNTEALRSQSRQELLASALEELPIWMEYPELTVFILDNSLEMTREQKIQLDSLMILALSKREFAWRQYETGNLDQETWTAERNIVSLLVGTERLRDWWAHVGQYGRDPGFVEVVDELIESQPYHPYWKALGTW